MKKIGFGKIFLFGLVLFVLVVAISESFGTHFFSNGKRQSYMTKEGVAVFIHKLNNESYRVRFGGYEVDVSLGKIDNDRKFKYYGHCKNGNEISVFSNHSFSDILKKNVSQSDSIIIFYGPEINKYRNVSFSEILKISENQKNTASDNNFRYVSLTRRMSINKLYK